MIVVFLVNDYLGAYDTNLSQFNTIHWDLNWVIAVVTLAAGLLLIAKPGSVKWVVLAGLLWPIVYLLSLGFDVATRLCSFASSNSCWPDQGSAFQYLILNNANLPGGLGWQLLPVMPVAIVLLVVVIVISAWKVMSMRTHNPGTKLPTKQM
jgi:hypothetical protein